MTEDKCSHQLAVVSYYSLTMFCSVFQLNWKAAVKIKIRTKEKSDARFIYLVARDIHWFKLQ